MAKQKKSVGSAVVMLLVVGLLWWLDNREGNEAAEAKENAGQELVISGGLNTRFSKTDGKVVGGYEVLNGARLVPNRRNDGDSFFVRHGKAETEFRLYFVDCPESAYREYRNGDTNGKRLREQGSYYGGLDRDETVQVGQTAKHLAKKLMGARPFTVITKWDNVYGPDRKYAFVVVDYQGEKVFLHELMVAHGLGRIHTLSVTLPDGRSRQSQLKFLKELERKAKKERRGGWKK